MAKTTKQLLSFAVALIMVLSLIPVTQIEAKAEATETTPSYPSAPEGINANLEFEADGKTAHCVRPRKSATILKLRMYF